MNFSKAILFTGVMCSFFSCRELQPRYPVNRSSDRNLGDSAYRNRTLYSIESQQIAMSIQSDSLLDYTASEKGFWYAFIALDGQLGPSISSGDTVVFKLKIESLGKRLLYDWDKAGEVTYRVDREEILPILREGIRLMKVGQKAVFLCPSYLGFGYLGDGNKIGVNQPLRITINILDNI